jgi:hypothetical protein
MFGFSKDDIAERKIAERKMEIMDKIKEVRELSLQLERAPSKKYTLFCWARLIVKMSRLIRQLNIHSARREEIISDLSGRC